MINREQEQDAAFALESLPAVTGVYALPDPGVAHVCGRADETARDDALLLAVALRPYSVSLLVEAHYQLVGHVDRGIGGRVLYVNADALPPVVRRSRLISLSSTDRFAAAVRVAAAARQVDVEERLSMEAKMTSEVPELEAPVAVSLESGVFEIVPDPFPSRTDRPRVLVADVRSDDADALREHGAVEVVHTTDGWSALEHLVDPTSSIALALCALKLGDDFSGLRLYKMVAKQRPEMAERIVFMASASAVASAPPSSALGRVLPQPISTESVLELALRWAPPS